jgi:glucuronate isomerase
MVITMLLKKYLFANPLLRTQYDRRSRTGVIDEEPKVCYHGHISPNTSILNQVFQCSRFKGSTAIIAADGQ